jgi:hypothetical protein
MYSMNTMRYGRLMWKKSACSAIGLLAVVDLMEARVLVPRRSSRWGARALGPIDGLEVSSDKILWSHGNVS